MNDLLLEWSMDRSGEFIQGPLDLGILQGKKISLNLEHAQLAILAAGPDLRAIYLDGSHILDVGSGPDQVSPECRLLFLATDRPLDLRWTFGSPIDLPGPGRRHIIGNCRLTISNPSHFFDAFLGEIIAPDPDTITEDVEKVARRMLTDFLAAACAEGPGFQVCLQTTLMNLQAQSLSEDLTGYGLTCTHLALYTAQPPVENGTDGLDNEETAGHSGHLFHN